ncbi:uncharacterized protein LOC119016409 [Acanthopagrus latus]|uniref:uncharacterized protein LOC119016408 n=1 Tax=Acanthopagrus latus TaxID=8177 RepID=UPI00187C6456|nr:uncharacterized protein LOC119016408 [Acanthopagrus latus]XP_036948082.1 uncharacterized protein LOC119016408 [Acanthopagrus latus]XP_036948083.1 uncharacterized protein LOC119016408 [Acanthopagrus latus]XP_036948084.1 uncharacterized protein LOC119016408 [Acanthopagrus latus]XP_036948086.1 uncharacterized protein LOC119016408 [Acanthopagrus latus]XP_036948087.1 uncharacterized protein LOC119016408 [Acanthopagrus latus]XP_036948088.1 uncharacterized protein LOC119016409 [Acanthopagrus latu
MWFHPSEFPGVVVGGGVPSAGGKLHRSQKRMPLAASWRGINQLSPAHRAAFPAVLTPRHGVDKQVVPLMRDRVPAQERPLHHPPQPTQPTWWITRILKHQFQRPAPKRELLSPRLLRKTFLIAETENMEDYPTQIMSTFDIEKVLKYDSTKKVECGAERKSYEIMAKHNAEILVAVIKCEESLDKMQPMAEGLMEVQKSW